VSEEKPTKSLFAILVILLFASFVVAGVLLLARAGYIKTTNLAEKIDNLFGSEGLEGIIPDVGSPDVVGVEVYDLSVYEQSEEAYAEALARMESDWFPRPAVVTPKGLEGGDFPNAPLPIYDAYPGQEATAEDGKVYEITRTWIGDIAVGTEVTLEGVIGQGEWCFVTAETTGGWSSSGWVWCYRLYIPDDTWVY
jgi:hypothetical protein